MTHVIHKVYSRVKQTSPERVKNDYYPTPPVATYSLLNQFPGYFATPKLIHEPAAGKGWISQELERNGHQVLSQDLYEYEDPLIHVSAGYDFLACEKKHANVMITNPPFSDNGAENFVRKALELQYDFIAILARITFLESMRRYKLFTEQPPRSVHVFSGRINCDEKLFADKQLGGLITYAWFVWNTNVARQPRTDLYWIDTKSMYEKWKAEQ